MKKGGVSRNGVEVGKEQREKVLMKAKGSELCLHSTIPMFCCGQL